MYINKSNLIDSINECRPLDKKIVIDVEKELLRSCVDTIRSNVEQDCEDGNVVYSLKLIGTIPSQVCLIRTVRRRSDELLDDGSVEIASYSNDVFEMNCSFEEYANIAIRVLSDIDKYAYEYGAELKKVRFNPIYIPI